MPPFLYTVFQKLLRRIEDMENIELQNRALWSANQFRITTYLLYTCTTENETSPQGTLLCTSVVPHKKTAI
jgi:hypothetical protein